MICLKKKPVDRNIRSYGLMLFWYSYKGIKVDIKEWGGGGGYMLMIDSERDGKKERGAGGRKEAKRERQI